MKKTLIIFGLFIVMCGFKKANFIVISSVKVPFEKLCGNGNYECRATGIAGDNLPSYRVYLKERPRGDGKTADFNFYNLGRRADTKAFNLNYPCISLNRVDVDIDTTVIDYDLKKDNLTNLIADLKASLKKNKVDAEVSLQILDEYKKTLNSEIVIKANLITYTIKNGVIDAIREARDGNMEVEGLKKIVKTLEGKNFPVIRQVIVIEEVCKFKEHNNIYNLLKPILKAKLGSDETKVDAVISLTKTNEKTSNFTSNYKSSTIYSYGYWSEEWMFSKK